MCAPAFSDMISLETEKIKSSSGFYFIVGFGIGFGLCLIITIITLFPFLP